MPVSTPSGLGASRLKDASLMSVSTRLPEFIVKSGLFYLIASIRACYQMMFMRSIPYSFSKIPLELTIMKSSSAVICIAVISDSALTI